MMKRISRIILLLLDCVICFSCTKQNLDEFSQNTEQVFFKAVHAFDINSKTSVDDDGLVYWSPNEQINIFINGSSVKFQSTNTEKSVTAVFVSEESVVFDKSKSTSIIGLYPYDANAVCCNDTVTTTIQTTQVATENTFAEKTFPCIAKTTNENNTLLFYNVCGGLKFTVGTKNIKKITIKGTNNELISGKVKTYIGKNGYPKSEIVVNASQKDVVLSSNKGLAVGATYYVITLPTVFANGLTVRFETDEMYAEKTYSGIREIKRSVWGNLGQVDKDVIWKEIAVENPLTFTSSGSTTIALVKNASPKNIVLEYRKNSGAWSPYTIGNSISLNNGETVSFQAGESGNMTFNKDLLNYYNFKISGNGNIAASGNIMSLLNKAMNPALAVSSYCFANLFIGCSKLTMAPELPATTLAKFCYYGMFTGCTSLTKAPKLPASTLADCCYEGLFKGCESLTKAPELPATTLAEDCYLNMFTGCKSLTKAPELPATALAENCYSKMFGGCMSLTAVPELPATALAKFCYYGMFNGCTSLTAAPKLPATTLADYCYWEMFTGCTSLTKAPELPATTLADCCYEGMFEGCESLTKAPELPAKILAYGCYNWMFARCPSLTEAPQLPAKTLADDCYQWMFGECASLTKAPELPATTLAANCYESMFNGCESLTTAPELPATALAENCYSKMFWGCISLIKAPELPATVLSNSCYKSMFYNCLKLDYIKCLATSFASKCTENWTYGLPSKGTFVKSNNVNWTRGSSGIPTGWTVKSNK